MSVLKTKSFVAFVVAAVFSFSFFFFFGLFFFYFIIIIIIIKITVIIIQFSHDKVLGVSISNFGTIYLTCIKIRAALGAPILVLREIIIRAKSFGVIWDTHC